MSQEEALALIMFRIRQDKWERRCNMTNAKDAVCPYYPCEKYNHTSKHGITGFCLYQPEFQIKCPLFEQQGGTEQVILT